MLVRVWRAKYNRWMGAPLMDCESQSETGLLADARYWDMLSLRTNSYPSSQHCLAAHVLYVSGDEGFMWVSVCISEGLAQGRILQEE